ncbi:hypothetical protein ACWGB8_11335 [Kitasatospora sp. NPDC054939]
MNTRIRDAGTPGRLRPADGPVGSALGRGLFLLAGLAGTVLGFVWFVDANDTVNAYRTAPVCATAAHAPGTDCVRRETGKVTDRHAGNGGDSTVYTLTVARGTAPKETFTVDRDLYSEAAVGSDVELTVFRGRVAEVSYHGYHFGEPGMPWRSCIEVAVLAGLGSALIVFGAIRARPGEPATPAALVGRYAGFVLVVFVAPALVGCMALVTLHLPIAVTLAAAVLGWLFLTAGVAVAVRGK